MLVTIYTIFTFADFNTKAPKSAKNEKYEMAERKSSTLSKMTEIKCNRNASSRLYSPGDFKNFNKQDNGLIEIRVAFCCEISFKCISQF